MIKYQLPEVDIEVHPDGDWLIRAKNTGWIQIPAEVVQGLTRSGTGRFQPKHGGWPLVIETVDGPITKVFATRREYREAKR